MQHLKFRRLHLVTFTYICVALLLQDQIAEATPSNRQCFEVDYPIRHNLSQSPNPWQNPQRQNHGHYL